MNTTPSSAAAWYAKLLPIATMLALGVVVLGAWVRLTDAGLGCPDWPGCYGTLTVPQTEAELATAEAVYPERPVETQKAWNEMIHRYFAGTLGLLVFAIVVLAFRARRSDPAQPVLLPGILGVLIIFQALLGMWTVTLLLKPAVVMSHLLGGMCTLGLLFWLTLRARRGGNVRPPSGHRRLALAAGILVLCQIALGGWTSTNYAALACPDLPTCQGQWWPDTDFGEAFVFWRGTGIDYEGGVLDGASRAAIHLTHRIGAVIVSLALILLGIRMLRSGDAGLRRAGQIMWAALALQIAIGIGIIEWTLPLWLATAHNGGGALLLLAMLFLNYETRYVQGRG